MEQLIKKSQNGFTWGHYILMIGAFIVFILLVLFGYSAWEQYYLEEQREAQDAFFSDESNQAGSIRR